MTKLQSAAQLIWDYHHLSQPLSRGDLIVCFCSNDLRVADYCARLWRDKFADKILFSGGLGRGTQGVFTRSEAELFGERARENGVDDDKIILETASTNTSENIKFTQQKIAELKINCRQILMVQKPYMERRLFATLQKQWSEMNFIITSPPITFANYPNAEIDETELINFMVGDLQRIIEYPKRGWQSEQHVPDEIINAMDFLLNAGYNRYALKDAVK